MSSRRKREVKRKLRFLKSRHRYLKTALSEIKEELKRYEQEWSHNLNYLTTELHSFEHSDDSNPPISSISFDDATVKNSEPEPKDECLNQENIDAAKSPEWAKSLYKKIARKTHPDKLGKAENINEMTEIFQEAAKSISSGNHQKLIDIALTLGIEIEMGGEEMIARLSDTVASIGREIKEIEESLPWLWGESFGLPNIRAEIAEKALAQKGISVEKSQLLEIINRIEKMSEE